MVFLFECAILRHAERTAFGYPRKKADVTTLFARANASLSQTSRPSRWMHMDKPDEFNAIMDAFLEEIQP